MLGLKYTVTTFFVCFFLFALHLVAVLSLEERRFSKKKTVLLWIVAGIVFFAVVYLCHSLLPKSIRFTASFMGSFLYFWGTFIYASADGFWKKCYLWVSYGCVFCFFWSLSSILSNLLAIEGSVVLVYYLRSLIQIAFCLPILLVYRRYGRSFIREVSGFHSKNWRRLFIVSLFYFIMFSMLMVKLRSNEKDVGVLLFYVFVALSFVAVTLVNISNIYYMKKEARDELVKQNVEYLTSYVEGVKEMEKETRRTRHDVRHHYDCIASMAREGDTEGILRYLGEEEERQERPSSFCPHVMVNGILSSYRNKTKDAGVSFIAQADTPFYSRIKYVDYVAILANLLENALNAAKGMESSGPIRAAVKGVGGKTVIVVSNPAPSGLKLENGLPINRSTGIDSVITASKRYNGEVEYKIEDGICTVCVVLSP